MTTSPPGCRPGENRSAGRAPRSLCSSRREVARGTILAAYRGVNEVVSRDEREHVAPLRFPPTVRDLVLLGPEHRLPRTGAGKAPAPPPSGRGRSETAETHVHVVAGGPAEPPLAPLVLACSRRSQAHAQASALPRPVRFPPEPSARGRPQPRRPQNPLSTRAPWSGSWTIHQWPSPSRTAASAPARAAARRRSSTVPP